MVCRNADYNGRKLPLEHIKKISQALKGKVPKNAWKSGPQHPMWNPNRTDQRERNTDKYKLWRFAVIKRDKYTCQICGDKRSSGKKFHIDHIKSFAKYPKLRYEIANGRVLCETCHRATPTYARKKILCVIRKRYSEFTEKGSKL